MSSGSLSWAAGGASVKLILMLLLASLTVQQAISINSDQQAPAGVAKSESNPAPSYQAQVSPAEATIAQQQAPTGRVSQAASLVTTSMTSTTTSTRRPGSQASRQQNGRVRRPTQVGVAGQATPIAKVGHGGHQVTSTSAPTSASDSLQDEIKRLVAEYTNTPPLFVTTTRDFFVDVARYPLGFKLATMQALDSEGDRIEYSLKPASYRDASPYFAINSTSGELRLANRRIPLVEQPSSGADLPDDHEQPDGDDDQGPVKVEQQQQKLEASAEKPGFLYFLNVAANDGNYTSIVELQIHVFNSTSFGTKSPVQLTIEGGRRGGESAMRAKTSDFLERLYRPAGAASAVSNSTLVLPSFINPSQVRDEEESNQATSMPITTPASLPQLQGNDLAASLPPFVVEPAAHYSQLAKDQRQLSDGALHHQPLMLSLVIVVCSCFTVALVLLIFVVPLSVRRIKKRLKNMELQHEQLSQKASSSAGGSSIVCSSANSMTGSGPSLSQFTLSGSSDRSCAMLQMPVQHRHQALGRQSSLDSAITSANFATQRYLPSQQQQQQQQQQQPQHNLFLNGRLNRLNNGAIANPIYLQSVQAAQLNNIYCPIDDDFYSTINGELEPTSLATPTRSGMIVGQTSDSRNYLASQCAPLTQQPLQSTLINGCDVDTARPPSRSSSRSSTRSLARFLSLPARHWQHQQQVESKQSFLDELEYHFRDEKRPAEKAPEVKQPIVASQTVARASHISQEHKRDDIKEQPQRHVWELERHKLKFIDILDEGQFGLVWRCKLASRTVAVKMLKSSAANDERERDDLLAEIEIMKRICQHPNIVKILHCCTRDVGRSRPILLVMEHVELGKLQSFLEKSRASHNYATSLSLYNHTSESGELQADEDENDGDEIDSSSSCLSPSTSAYERGGGQLTSRELIKFIYHVAKGMEYVSANCIVHRDLASRNILISGQRVCKIGDFGMARHMVHGDVYERRSRNTKIPVRWMAPEVLLHNCFTTKSDVYSFGILMWEIVTLGSTPYASLKMDQIVEAVARAGARPSKPDYCHSLLYSIMSRCWSEDPSQRPSFTQLVGQLDELLLSTNEYIELDQYPDHNYYNITAAPGELV